MACAEELTNTIDCARICNRYSDCVTDIDVTSCTDKCEDDADATETVEIQLETCEDCVDNGSCSEIDDCWSDCPVVPVQD